MTENATPRHPVTAPAVEQQIHLPLKHALLISARGIRNRIGRTFISMAAILLGITFFISIVSSNRLTDIIAEQGIHAADSEEEAAASAAVAVAADPEERRQQQIWLIAVALLVAGIGITNAMLMSVTERFREIGTMKCLGALDSFIVEILLFETSFLGLIGSAIGCLVGTVLAVVSVGVRYGFASVGLALGESWAGLLKWYVVALVMGLVLSILAAIYPAIRAARMMPAEAMRTDV